MKDTLAKGAAAGAVVCALLAGQAHAQEMQPCIGNVAALTGPAAFSGASIKWGAQTAIDEINAAGGVLGKSLRLVQYDDAGAPPKGVDGVRRIALSDKCVAVLGGYHSTVALAMVDPVHAIGIPYIGVIAANTKVIDNGRDPNLMFRVSARDQWVAAFLVEEALKGGKSGKVGILYENTGWGNGALTDIKAALAGKGAADVGAEIFNWGDQDMTPQLIRLRDAGADTVIVWGLDREGNQILRGMDKLGYKPQVISAWGLAGNLGELAGPLADGVKVVQTYSWMGELDARGKDVFAKIQGKFGVKDPSEIKQGSGTANAYDAVHILARAIGKAGAYDWAKVAAAMYDVEYDGLVTSYKPAFKRTKDGQEAIGMSDYKLTAWHQGKLLPIAQTPYK